MMNKWKIVIPALIVVFTFPLLSAALVSSGSAAGQEAESQHDHDHGDESADRTIQITVWDELFEIFIEHPPMAAEEAGEFITHITELEGFTPRTSGPVTFLISREDVSRRYVVDEPLRAGIYVPRLIFPDPGQWDMTLIVGEGQESRRIELGKVRVFGSAHDILHAALPEPPDGISFLKERQWDSDFNTAVVKRGETGSGKGILLDETALISEGGGQVVFVQLGGETFEKRSFEQRGEEDGKILVISGLADGERVVTSGAWAVAEAEYATEESHDHQHSDGDEAHSGEVEDAHAGHDHAEVAPVVQQDGGAPDPHAGHDHGPGEPEPGEAGGVDGDDSGHDDEGGQIVHMTEENMKKFGIELRRAGPGIFEIPRKTQGEIVLNADRTAHIVPRVSGITVEVQGNLGDEVKKGDLIAVIESPDLADSKASYLASVERFELAKVIFEREERLRADGISSESEYLEARRGFAEAKIEFRSSRQKLLALGLRMKDLSGLASAAVEEFARHEIRAPFGGTIIKKHLAVGEAVESDSDIFLISSLDTVWADLRIYQSDVGSIRAGQEVIISVNHGDPIFSGRISYVDPVIDVATRTALARVILDNRSGNFNPGTFVSADIISEKRAAALVVARSVIQEIDDHPCVFVWDGHGFILRPVELGHRSGKYAEITSGLKPGEMIAATNSFRLKAELTKSEDASCSAHGHAH